jgi:hypothetical protein
MSTKESERIRTSIFGVNVIPNADMKRPWISTSINNTRLRAMNELFQHVRSTFETKAVT